MHKMSRIRTYTEDSFRHSSVCRSYFRNCRMDFD